MMSIVVGSTGLGCLVLQNFNVALSELKGVKIIYGHVQWEINLLYNPSGSSKT